MCVDSTSVRAGCAGSVVLITATPWSSNEPRYPTAREASAATLENCPSFHGFSAPTSVIGLPAALAVGAPGVSPATTTASAKAQTASRFISSDPRHLGSVGAVFARQLPRVNAGLESSRHWAYRRRIFRGLLIRRDPRGLACATDDFCPRWPRDSASS